VIGWFSPQTVQAGGGESILLNVEPVFGSTVYCKFNHEVTKGWTTVNHSVMCRAPRLRGSEAELSLSSDNTLWSRPVLVLVAQDESDLNWIIGGALLLVVGYILKKTLFKKRKKRAAEGDEKISEEAEKDRATLHRTPKPADV
jgi:hypothetical protein